ncbi:MAG: P-loop NTPase [Nitrospina sp.]|nr:P-loop NTPase [Nitrospina sp.]
MISELKVVAVGSGKGGVGKSLLCANMAIAMALSGMKVVLVDTDYGASNLHALLGISNPRFGLKDLFQQTELDPEDFLLNTGIDNLKFMSGAGDLPGSANLTPEQLSRIHELIRSLEADMAFLDLAPGNSYTNMDLFNLADEQVVVCTPEMTAAMNTLSFIKTGLFRKISGEFTDDREIHDITDYSRHLGSDEEVFEINRLRMKVLDKDKDALARLNAVIRNYRPHLVLNRVRRKKDLLMGDNVVQLARKYLEVETDFCGYLIESERIHDSVDEMIPFLIKDPQSPPSKNIQQIVGALTKMDIHLVKKDGAIYVSKQVKLTAGWES